MNADTKLAGGSRSRTSSAVSVSTFAGAAQPHVRASTKNRTIALSAATSRPLPLTSPTSTATAPPGSVHAPNTSPPPTSRPAGS